MDDLNYLPIFRRTNNRQPRLLSPLLHKWMQTIPVIVLLFFFILWWFSHPVNLVVKDGRIEEIHPIKIHPLNGTTYVELTTNSEKEGYLVSKND